MKLSTVLVAVLLARASVPTLAQRRLPSTPGLLDRVSTAASVEPAEAHLGSTVVLRLEVRPNRGIRVFAPGARQFTPVVVVLSRPKGIKSGAPSYGVPTVEKNPGNDKRVPLYTGNFHIDHTVTIDKNVKPGTEISVAGALTYQTCDERNVYPERTLSVRWTIRVTEP